MHRVKASRHQEKQNQGLVALSRKRPFLGSASLSILTGAAGNKYGFLCTGTMPLKVE
jgi:hypothetical protein